MIFSHPQRNIDAPSLKINGVDIERVQSHNFLGITIDAHLTWKEQINRIKNKISRTLGIMTRIRNFVPSPVLKMIYCSLILPYLNYCTLVWGLKTDTSKLEVIQRKAVRIIDNAFFLEHTEKLFKKYKLLRLKDIIIQKF